MSKVRDERLVILNTVAKSVIEKQRGQHKRYVFPFGKPDGDGNETMVHRMNDSAWKKARVRAAKKWQEKYFRQAHDGFARIRIHDLKHTFGRRLRAAGVTEEDRKALLGHKNGSIPSHYSAAELDQLIEAASKQGISNRLTRTSADDPEEEAGVAGKPKVTRKVTRVEMKKPSKRWLSH